MRPVLIGSVDCSVTIKIVDATDFSPETGVTSASGGLALWYRKGATGALTALTESDLATVATAHADGGMKHVSDGVYRVDLPDAAIPTAEGEETTFGGTVTGMQVLGGAIVGAYTIGAPAGASVSADIAVIESQTDDIGAAGAGLTALGDARLANLDAAVSSRSTVTTAQVNTEADAALADAGVTSARMAYLTGPIATAAKLLSYFQSALRKDVTVDTDIGGNYDDATDSQEAIRDRGDAAWGSAGATGALTTGTAQAGSTSTTIKLASGASTTDDLYNYLIVLIDGGTGVGQARMITDYVGSTRVATVDRAWITTPDATSTYRVHHWSDNWAGTVRTLTNAAGDAVDTDADPITRMRGDSWSIEITGIGAIPTWTKAWFTVKCHTGDLDADAWLMIVESNPGAGTDGLQAVYGGGSITAGNAALSVDDTAAGDVTITVAAVETAKLPERATLVYDVQIKLASGDILTRKGTFAVTADVTRATS